MRICFLVNKVSFLHSHRSNLIFEALRRDWEVVVYATDSEDVSEGIRNVDYRFPSKNFLRTLLKALYDESKYDVIHVVTFKPLFLFYFFLIKKRSSKVVFAVSGLGYIFISASPVIRKTLLLVIASLERIVQLNWIFQNYDDLLEIKRQRIRVGNYRLIRGSGVCGEEFSYDSPVSGHRKSVLMASRLIKDKGLFEYAAAVNDARVKYPNVEFKLAGGLSDNPSALTKEGVNELCTSSGIHWIGEVSNIRNEIIQSSFVVLPSYREGLPRFLIEAMAIGRPIITTNVPGCKECYTGKNGILVEPRNKFQLYQSIIKLLSEDDFVLQRMGMDSRRYFEENFEAKHIVNNTFSYYEDIL